MAWPSPAVGGIGQTARQDGVKFFSTAASSRRPGDGVARHRSNMSGELTLDPSRHQCSWKGQNVDLTVTEFLILKSLALRPGHVKSRDQLMDGAYGEHIYVDDRTIDSHIKRLRKKFKVIDDDFAQIETLYGVGYRYRDA